VESELNGAESAIRRFDREPSTSLMYPGRPGLYVTCTTATLAAVLELTVERMTQAQVLQRDVRSQAI
jgi:hypothetical protein